MLRLILISTLILSLPCSAWSWGSYGHQQVNYAAVKLIESRPGMGACLKKNLQYMQRLSITPDSEWKMSAQVPHTKELSSKRASIAAVEKEEHFFEVDRYVKEDATAMQIKALPTLSFDESFVEDVGGNRARKGMLRLFKDNLAQAKKINPDKFKEGSALEIKGVDNQARPTAAEIAKISGASPWRILQLYEKAVNELSESGGSSRDLQLALMYMGVMGHYVGDMSQPFHATANYQGEYYLAEGSRTKFEFHRDPDFALSHDIHFAFEDKMLEMAYNDSLTVANKTANEKFHRAGCEAVVRADGAKTKGDVDAKVKECTQKFANDQNPLNRLWPSFEATENEVISRARRVGLAPISPANVVSEVMELVAGSYTLVKPLLFTFAKAKVDSGNTEPKENAPASAIRALLTTNLVTNANGTTNRETGLSVAQQRLAESAALLARLWLSIEAEAKKRNSGMSLLTRCQPEPFTNIETVETQQAFVEFVINNYPRPEYRLNDGRDPQSVKAVRGISEK